MCTCVRACVCGGGGNKVPRALALTPARPPTHPSMRTQVMRWIEQCAFISAARVCRGGHLLTASMDSIAFSSPTRVGDIVYIEAQVGC